MKEESDNLISEKMFLARRDTEQKVHSIRVRQRKEFELLLEREKRRALLEIREEAMTRINSFLDDLSTKVEARSKTSDRTGPGIRRSLPPWSWRPLKPLVKMPWSW